MIDAKLIMLLVVDPNEIYIEMFKPGRLAGVPKEKDTIKLSGVTRYTEFENLFLDGVKIFDISYYDDGRLYVECHIETAKEDAADLISLLQSAGYKLDHDATESYGKCSTDLLMELLNAKT